LEAPEIAVLILSTYDNPTYVARAVALERPDMCLRRGSGGVDRCGAKGAAGESAWTRDELRRVTGALATHG